MTDPPELAERIDRLCRNSADADHERTVLIQMEDLLAQGYIEALRGEARSRRLAERLEALMGTLDAPGAMLEAQTVARERQLVDASVKDLRLRLRVLRDQHARLGGGQSACHG